MGGAGRGEGHRMGHLMISPEKSKHVPLWRGNEGHSASGDFRRPAKGLTGAQDCPLGNGGSPDLRPGNTPGIALQLNGTSVSGPESPRVQLEPEAYQI